MLGPHLAVKEAGGAPVVELLLSPAGRTWREATIRAPPPESSLLRRSIEIAGTFYGACLVP